MKKLLIASAVAAVAVAPAHAAVKISGQVNQAAILSSDLDDIEVVDNNTSGSRFRFVGSKEFGAMKAGARYEIQLQDNNSSGLLDSLADADSADGSGDGSDGEVRVSEVYLAGGFGKVAIGKGSGAADGSFESYGLLGHYLAGDLARLTVGNAIDAGVSYRSIDGLSRQNRIRYDSPKFGGFKFALSLDNGGKTEVGAAYGGKVGGGKIRARVGVTSGDSDTNDRTSASIAWKSSFGLGLGYSLGDRGDDFDTNWATISYQFGKFVAQFNFGDDSNDNEMSVIGLNWKATKGVEVYLNRLNAENADGTEGDAVYLGSRVKF